MNRENLLLGVWLFATWAVCIMVDLHFGRLVAAAVFLVMFFIFVLPFRRMQEEAS